MPDDKKPTDTTPPPTQGSKSTGDPAPASLSSGNEKAATKEDASDLSHKELKVRTMKDDMKGISGKGKKDSKSIAVDLDQGSEAPHVDKFTSDEHHEEPQKPFQAQGIIAPKEQKAPGQIMERDIPAAAKVPTKKDEADLGVANEAHQTVKAPKEAAAIGEEIKNEISKLKGDEPDVMQQDFVESKPLDPNAIKKPDLKHGVDSTAPQSPRPLGVDIPKSNTTAPPVSGIESSKPGNIAYQPKKQKMPIIAVVSVVTAILLIGGGAYFYFAVYLNTDSESAVDIPVSDPDPLAVASSTNPDILPSISSFTPSKSLLTPNDEVVIEVNSPIAVSHQLRLEGRKGQISATLKRVTFVLNEFVESSKLSSMRKFLASVGLIASDVRVTQRELTFSEFRDVMKISLPGYMINYFSEKFDVYMYRESDGPRIGVAMQLQDSHKIVENLKQWEETMPDSFSQLYLDLIPQDPVSPQVESDDQELVDGEEVAPQPERKFSDSAYASATIRSLPQPDSLVGIFYTYLFDQQLFLVGTSQDTIEKMIESALSTSGSSIPQTPKEQQIVLESVTRDDLARELRRILQRTYSPGSLTTVVVQSLNSENHLEEVSEEKIEEMLRIPNDVAGMSSTYRFAVFAELSGENKFIISSDHSGEAGQLSQALKRWELKMPEDLNILISRYALSDEGFLDSDIGGKAFRFIRLPDSDNGLSYIVGESNYFISTSKDSFRIAEEKYLR